MKILSKVYSKTDLDRILFRLIDAWRLLLAAWEDSAGISSLQVSGAGTPAHSHVSDIYAPDHEGVYPVFEDGEPVFEGGRVVRNEFLWSEDISDVVWIAAEKTSTGFIANASSQTLNQATINAVAGESFIVVADIETDKDLGFIMRVNDGANISSAQMTAIAGISKRYTFSGVWLNTQANAQVQIVRSSDVGADYPVAVIVDLAQFENSTGRTDPTLPSEYIKTESATVQKVFPTTNGNTVLDNVVTEGIGIALDPLPMLVDQPDATNSRIYSNDLTNAEWVATNITVALDEDGIDGSPLNASTLTATAANGTVVANAITAVSDTHATVWHIKRKTGTGTIELTLDNGTTWQDITSSISSEFSRIAVDQAIVTDPQIGIRLVTDTDAVIVGNAEGHLTKVKEEVENLGAIFTTSSPVSTDAVETTYPSENLNNSAGAFYCEVEVDGDQKIVGSFIEWLDPNFKLTDTSTNNVSVAGIAGATNEIGVAWNASAGLMALKINSTWSSDTTYSGVINSGDLDLFRSGIFPGRIRNIRTWKGGTLAQLKAKVDGVT